MHGKGEGVFGYEVTDAELLHELVEPVLQLILNYGHLARMQVDPASLIGPRRTVLLVSLDMTSDGGKLRPYLVVPSGLQLDFQQVAAFGAEQAAIGAAAGTLGFLHTGLAEQHARARACLLRRCEDHHPARRPIEHPWTAGSA